jgi:cell division cycle 14
MNLYWSRSAQSVKTEPVISVITERVYLAQNIGSLNVGKDFRVFRPKIDLVYHDDSASNHFGPLCMSKIVHLIKALDKDLTSYPDSYIVFQIENGKRNFTNAVFLLGAYMILKENFTAASVVTRFARVDTTLIVPYCDLTCEDTGSDLSLLDCWQGLEKGKACSWVNFSNSPTMWGKINISFYRHYASMANGDMHLVIPGKFVAFQGPIASDLIHERDVGPLLDPSSYIDVFSEIGVTDIVRLNKPRYDAAEYAARGFRHHDLYFPADAFPPEDVVSAFLAIAEAARGTVAVHCTNGLARTGTLIALYLMRAHGFGAREAVAWLRVMRPGSVDGRRQRYLCAVDEILQGAAL